MKEKTKENVVKEVLDTEVFETKDIVTATYLKVNGLYCIGTIPAGNKSKPNERLWMFEYTPALQKCLDELAIEDPLVPIRETFVCTSILKNLLNDKDDLNE